MSCRTCPICCCAVGKRTGKKHTWPVFDMNGTNTGSSETGFVHIHCSLKDPKTYPSIIQEIDERISNKAKKVQKELNNINLVEQERRQRDHFNSCKDKIMVSMPEYQTSKERLNELLDVLSQEQDRHSQLCIEYFGEFGFEMKLIKNESYDPEYEPYVNVNSSSLEENEENKFNAIKGIEIMFNDRKRVINARKMFNEYKLIFEEIEKTFMEKVNELFNS